MKALSDLIGSSLPILWHEAVAVVQEVASHVSDDGGVPPDADLLFGEDGTITVGGAGPRRFPVVTALGGLLQRLLPDDAPAALHALASENSTEQPTHPTLAVFTAALAFFERPGRAAHLLGLATRLQNYRPPDPTDDELVRLRKKVIDAPEEPPAAAAPRRSIHLAYAAGGAVALVIVAWAGAKLPVAPLLAAVSSASIAALVGSSTAAAPKTADPAPESLTSADVSNRNTDSPASGRVPASRRRAISHREASHSEAAVVASDPPPFVAISPADRMTDSPMPGSRSSDPGRAAASPLQPTNAPRAMDQDTTFLSDPARIYSSADTGVTPASLVRPQLPSQPQPGPMTELFDLTVDEAGNVVTVRLVSPGGRYQDRLLVSAAKAWRFRPALLDGRPVKYRLSVPINLPGQQ